MSAGVGGCQSDLQVGEQPGIDSDGATTESESGDDNDDGESTGDDEGLPKLDVAFADMMGDGDECKSSGIIGDGACSEQAPPDSFDPVIEWEFANDPDTNDVLAATVTPLVGNFTDDNGDGEIDLCDDPDVLVVAGPGLAYTNKCAVYVLDGATGDVKVKIPREEGPTCYSQPAFADVDGDGFPELLGLYQHGALPKWTYRLRAWEFSPEHADGWAVDWDATQGGENLPNSFAPRLSAAIAVHDLDADGDGEVILQHEVYDHEGNLLWDKANPWVTEGDVHTAADLDGDGMLEVIFGHAVYRWDGTRIYDFFEGFDIRGLPAVADLDGDDLPEILLTTPDGLALFEHDGTNVWGPLIPDGAPPMGDHLTWMRPATIHDFDGDGEPEVATSAKEVFAVYEITPTGPELKQQWPIDDNSGAAGSTAFDFLGDGTAEAMYADEENLFVFDTDTGDVVIQQPRCSPTLLEYPVVADVDNDGSAEVLIVSSDCGGNQIPALQVYRDAEDRWVGSRRIWNQHAYSVTNILEDGSLPIDPINSWEYFNTFRTNPQLEGGNECIPAG